MSGIKGGRLKRAAPKDTEGRMPLMDHLRELRNRLVKSVLAIIVITCVAAFFYRDIAAFLVAPVCDLKDVNGTAGRQSCGEGVLVQQGVLDPFSMALKISLSAGVIGATPVWLYQLWAFVAPGLHKSEKRYSLSFVGLGVPLFLGGAYFAYWILPQALKTLLGFTIEDAANQILLNDYLDFITRMVVVFGLACELPLVLILLNFGGVLTAKQMLGAWRWVVMGIFLFGAVATPTTDPLTMCLLSIPITVLFVFALLVSWINDRRRRKTRIEAQGGRELDDDEASPLDLGGADADEDAVATRATAPVPQPSRIDDIT